MTEHDEKEEIMKKFGKIYEPELETAAKDFVKNMLNDIERTENEKEIIREKYQVLVESAKKFILSKIEETCSNTDQMKKMSALSLWATASKRAKTIKESISELESANAKITSESAYEIICGYINFYLALSRALSVTIDERYYSDVALFKRFVDQARPAIKYLNDDHIKKLNEEIFSFIGYKHIFYEDEAEKEKVKSLLSFDQKETQALKKEINKLVKGYKDTSITKTTKKSLRRYYEKVVKECTAIHSNEVKTNEVKIISLPEKLLVTNTKADKKIIDGSAYEKRKRYITARDRFGDPIEENKVALFLWMNENEVNKFTDIKLDYYDLTVFFAVASLFYNGQSKVSLHTIYRAMTGNRHANATNKQKEEIFQSLSKLASTQITIEEKGLNFKYEGNFFAWGSIRGNYQGWEDVDIIKIMSLAWEDDKKGLPLIEYAKAKGQLIFTPLELLNIRKLNNQGKITDKVIRSSKKIDAIKFYLRSRIFQIRGETSKPAKRRRSGWNVILLSSIRDKLKLDKKNDDKTRKYIESILDYWKALETKDKGGHFILDYKKERVGNEYKYIIELQ